MIYEQFLSNFTDWRPETLYWQRFSIAEKFGKDEIKNVYNEIFEEAKEDYKRLTELVMVLNHKSWEHNEYQDPQHLCSFYSELFYATNKYALSTLTEDELTYFLNVTD